MNRAKLNNCWWAYLAILVFRFGGVAGATRRIVSTWPGEFTSQQIEASLRALYPGLRPAEFQVADGLEWMRRRQLIECVAETGGGKIFRRSERRVNAITVEREPQLTLSFDA
jgi:hypothetical protein